jgi:diguanylate cyclase (GGDEF)-like protein
MSHSILRALACSALLAILLAAPSLSRASSRFQLFTARDGLPQQQVLSLHQDELGYLWVGTFSGLGRYNGREFRTYSTADGLASNTVQAMATTADGQLWVGTTRGLCRRAKDSSRFECPSLAPLPAVSVQALVTTGSSLLVGSAEGLFLLLPAVEGGDLQQPEVRRIVPSLNISSLAGAEDGSVWIGTQTGLLRWNAVSGQYATVQLPMGETRAISALLSEPGGVWIGSSSGLLRMADGAIVPIAGLPEPAIDMPISAIARGRNGELWATGNRGVLRLGTDRIRLLQTEDGLDNQHNHTVLVDREGTVWIGSDGGLNRLQTGAFESYLRSDGLLGEMARVVREDAEGRLWIGSREGVQIVSHDGQRWRFDRAQTITRAQGLIDERVYDIAFPARGEALIATNHGVAHWREGEGIVRLILEQDGLPAQATRSLRVEADGRVWIGTMTGVALMRDGEVRAVADPLLSQARALSIREDGRGRLWFGTLHHGLLRMDTDGSVQRLGREAGLTDEIIWDIAADAEGGLWVGSNGDGLLHIDRDDRVQRFTTQDGLVDNFVWNVLAEPDGTIWAYTSRGLARKSAQGFSHFGEADGLPSPEGSATAALRTRAGELWFGASTGLTRYAPDAAARAPQAPSVIIEEALAGGSAIQTGSSLPAGVRDLALQFAALHLQRPQDLSYRFRLRGGDGAWSAPAAYRPITYAALAPASYVFEVQARVGNGDWGPISEFAFDIPPAAWERPGLYALGLLGLLAAAGLLVRFRLRRAESRRTELEAQIQSRTLALAEANRRLEQASLSDPLTGLANRRFLARQVSADVAQLRRAYRSPAAPGVHRDLVFLMVDIDHFKQINDSHGHAAGDSVLRRFAALLVDLIRESDYAVRWGGEEFLIVARQADARQAGAMAERIVQRVRDTRFPLEGGQGELSCTCSVGVAAAPFIPGDPESLEWEQVVALADAAVYHAKRRGRDGWVEVAAANNTRSADLPDLLEGARTSIEASAARGLLTLRTSATTQPV